jgi:hypothetical protein
MKDFRLDELTITRIAETDNFKVDGVCNADKIGNQNANTELPHPQQLLLDVTGKNESDKLSFSFEPVSFDGSYEDNDTLRLNIVEKSGGKVIRSWEIGGFAIKDTDYPPPSGARSIMKDALTHKQFTELLKIKELKFTRDLDSPDKVSTRITFTVAGAQKYAHLTSNPATDPSGNRAVQIVLIPVASGSDEVIVATDAIDDLGRCVGRGLSYIVASDKLYDWTTYTRKKILAFICN